MLGLHPGSLEIDPNTGKVVQGTNPVIDFKMNGNMRIVFFSSLIAFTILYVWMWKIRSRALIIKENLLNKSR
jgi:hypothetical protein